MEHFSIGRWTDFARGLTRGADGSAMEAHLASCERCRAMAEALTRVTRASESERRSEPPEHALRSVKAVFGLGRHGSAAALYLPRTFDSALAPAPAGIRGTAKAARQLVFEAPDLSLHLRVESEEERDELLLTGQLIREDGGEASGVPAYLVADGEIAAATLTREAGAFRLEGRSGESLEVWMLVDPDRRVAVSLE